LAAFSLGGKIRSDNRFSRRPRATAKETPGIKFVVSYGYSVAYATEAVLLPLKAVCRPGARYEKSRKDP